MVAPFRITQSRIATQTFNNLQSNLERMSRLQGQLSSGKQIQVPSDSPAGAADSMRFRGDIRRNDQYIRNAEDGMGWLGVIDQSMQSMLTSTQRVRDLLVQGINGSNDATSRAALAGEVGTIRASVIQQSNAEYLGRPVLVGTVTGATESYNAAGVYQGGGAADVINRTVGVGTPVRINLTGPEALGTSPNDLFTLLTTIQANIASGNTTNMSNNLAQLDTIRTQMQSALSDVGSRFNRLEAMKTRAEDANLNLRKGLSEVEDIDLSKTITDLQLQEVAYKASLSATARVLQPSLVEFLR
jgi:flagellar hook-associated protein 3 FlgL